MSDYNKTTNFLAKDGLTSGDPNKIVKGAEIDTELSNVATSVATKANKIIAGLANDVVLQTSTGDMKTAGWGFPNVNADITSSDEELNALDGFTGNVADLNVLTGTAALGVTPTEVGYLDGVTSAIQAQLDSKGTEAYTDTAISNLADGVSGPKLTPKSLGIQAGYMYLGDESDGVLNYTVTTNIDSDEKYCSSFNIDAGETLGVTESNNGFIIIRCTGTATIAGTIDLSGKGNQGGIKPVSGSGRVGTDAGFGAAGGGGVGSSSYGGGTGGQGAFSSGGGGAGSANPTTDASDASVLSARTESFIERHVGQLSATYLASGAMGGAGGGSGASEVSSDGGSGGNGGGCIVIIADEIDFTGTINVNGANGANSVHSSSGSGGGGGGGSVLLVARNFINNTGTITANGGTGGAYGAYNGGAGAAGHYATITVG